MTIRILLISLLAIIMTPSERIIYEVVNIEGTENVKINNMEAVKKQTVRDSDMIFICNASKLKVRNFPYRTLIEILSSDMIDNKPTNLSSAIERSMRRQENMTTPGMSRKGSSEMSSSISIVDEDGTVLNGTLSGRPYSTRAFFQIINESRNDLFYFIGWNDSKGFRIIGEIIMVKAGETYRSKAKEFLCIEKGEILSLHASMDRYQTEQFELIDYVEL